MLFLLPTNVPLLGQRVGAPLLMEGNTERTRGAEDNPQPTASKEPGTSVQQPKRSGLRQQPELTCKLFAPQSPPVRA